MDISITRGGLKIDNNLVPLVSASMQYWRIERGKWAPILDMVAELGFKAVETYMPWSAHETDRGKFDFGDKDPALAVEDFIKLCAERDMLLVARPGPHINAEMTCFGYPERVLRDPQCLSVSVDGDPVWMPVPPKMWPAPSYAADAFYDEVGLWFDALAPILKKHLASEGGPIAAIQIYNEFCNMFRNSAYDHDYHPDAIKMWEKFMREKRGADPPDPPREFAAADKSELPLYLDWIEFKEHYMTGALKRLRAMWEDRGVRGVPMFGNYPVGGDVPPLNWTEIEKSLDFQGPDMYPTRKQYNALKALSSFASGISRLPAIPEFSSGSFFWSAPLTVRDQEFTTPAAFMHGIKSINFYMLVERERWYGSPITRDGRKRPEAWSFYEKFMAFLDKARLHELEKHAPAILLSVRDYERLAQVATLLDPIPPLTPFIISAMLHASADDLGFSAPIQQENETRWNALFHGMSAAKVSFDCGNTSQDAEAIARYKMAALPTYDFLDAAVQEKLVAYARGGGALLIGPVIPELDADMKPLAIIKDALEGDGEDLAGGRVKSYQVGEGKIIVIAEDLPNASDRERPESTTELVRAIAEALAIETPYAAADPFIECALHEGAGRAVLFVANPTGGERVAKINLDGNKKLTDVASGEEFAGEAEIPMPGYTVRAFEVE